MAAAVGYQGMRAIRDRICALSVIANTSPTGSHEPWPDLAKRMAPQGE
jgi:hypothetical protein